MADLLGLNSVLSLSGCIVQIFKTIEDVRHAPREVQDLKVCCSVVMPSKTFRLSSRLGAGRRPP